jgi:NhaA family Na+:H+ antiporter
MANENAAPAGGSAVLQGAIDPARDHIRGGQAPDTVSIVLYGDYLCPYCRRLRFVLARLRHALGERLVYVFRQFPNERAHPGSEFIAHASEAVAKQGRFWDMHDWLYAQEPGDIEKGLRDFVGTLAIDMERFERDLKDDATKKRVDEDVADGKRNGVTATPTVFIDGYRYDGAWDFYSMLEALERPVAARVERSARAFASLPASGGLVLLLAAAVAILFANSPLAPYYRLFINSTVSIGTPGSMLSMTVGAWFSEGLLSIFFLLVGLEIRREMTAGALSDPRAAILPVLGAIGGVLAPTAIYLLLNPGPAARGWSVPTATDIAFTLGILALLGNRITPGLRVFVAALAVVDDILSVLTLAIFYPKDFEATWLFTSALCALLLYALNRWRVYAASPYVLVAVLLGISLHGAGVHAALAGVFLAAFLPTRPAPAAGPLLAQAATALAALEHAESEAKQAGDNRTGTDMGLGQPQPFRRKRPAAVAGRPHRARGGAVERLRDPAAVCLFRHRCRSARRSHRAGCGVDYAGRDPGAGDRKAAGHLAGFATCHQSADCARSRGCERPQFHWRGVPVRRRRYGVAVVGRPGFSGRAGWRRREDRCPDRIHPRGRPRCGCSSAITIGPCGVSCPLARLRLAGASQHATV